MVASRAPGGAATKAPAGLTGAAARGVVTCAADTCDTADTAPGFTAAGDVPAEMRENAGTDAATTAAGTPAAAASGRPFLSEASSGPSDPRCATTSGPKRACSDPDLPGEPSAAAGAGVPLSGRLFPRPFPSVVCVVGESAAVAAGAVRVPDRRAERAAWFVGEAPDAEPESAAVEPDESVPSANAGGIDATAAPTPSATANAPTRPTWRA